MPKIVSRFAASASCTFEIILFDVPGAYPRAPVYPHRNTMTQQSKFDGIYQNVMAAICIP